jgi:hypothetical protein
MQLPKYFKGQRQQKLKLCKEPGCGKEFWGHPIAKYCELHRNLRNRVRKRRQYKDVSEDNMIFKHRFSETTIVEFPCALKGCSRKFMLKIYPKLTVYPKYCEEHRVEFKRNRFLKGLTHV